MACAAISAGAMLLHKALWDWNLRRLHAETLSQKKETSRKDRGNKGRGPVEGQLEAGPGLPETEWGPSLVRMGKACNYFIFLKLRTVFFFPLRTVLLEFKRNTRRQTGWRSQRKAVQALASIRETR